VVDSLIVRNKHSCRPSRPDNRDWVYQVARAPVRDAVDLREWDTRVEDQKTLGSCVGQALTGAYEMMLRRNYPNNFTELSSLFVYYNARLNEDLTDIDAGTTIRSAIQGIARYGVCTEELWPYDVEKFDIRPSPEAYSDGRKRTLENYRRLYGIPEMTTAINNNRPVVIGMSVYSQFIDISKTNPVVELPENKFADYYGEHAVFLVGYNKDKKQLLAKNSFGSEWGENGYFWIPYDYARSEVFEAWIFDIVLK
jgi:C1A family cysteine protease